jgi:hypothetical protein
MDNNIRDDNDLCFVMAVGIIVLSLTGITASLGIDLYDGTKEIQRGVGFIDATKDNYMQAMVKGSIYGNGEAVSVFGTCMDEYGIPVVNSSGTLSAWYPNGTVYLANQSMENITSGYFVYIGNMSIVSGTYLTEFMCKNISGATAKAWGEWQNPVWVADIAESLVELNDTQALITDVNNDIIGINTSLVDMNNTAEKIYTNITYIYQNISFIYQNMTNSFDDLTHVANGSVDRNNSLLADLLYRLINYSGTPIVNNLTWVTAYNLAPVYRAFWDVNVTAYNEYGQVVGSPEVDCTINATDSDIESMHWNNGLDVFTAKIFVSGWNFEWNTSCHYE